MRRILILAARVWRDENGLSWLTAPPLIQMIPGRARKPYPLSWREQRRLFAELPEHLEGMAPFKVNTGTRQNEVCQLRWDWEVRLPELETTVFIIPEWLAKNGEERIVVLNEVARAVVDRQRGRHPEYVFTYKGHRLSRMITTAWKKARLRVGLPQVRVHDLKHTIGHRLRAAGVPFEEFGVEYALFHSPAMCIQVCYGHNRFIRGIIIKIITNDSGCIMLKVTKIEP